ncbi:MAG: ribosome maturation factor RimM [Saprospiraceae bacterium]|nr:ribosome maturation factor RimM [Saprospiraceae bacterium]
MQLDELTTVGTLRKTHGVHGEIKFEFDPFYGDDVFGQTVIIIETEGEYLPFFIETMDETTSGKGILKLEDINTKEAAARLNGKSIFLNTKSLAQVKEEALTSYVGFLVKDVQLGDIGIVQEIIEMPQQLLLQLDFKGKEILIPLHDDFIKAEHPTKKELLLKLPEGFLEIF